jgi:hypothetical protein
LPALRTQFGLEGMQDANPKQKFEIENLVSGVSNLPGVFECAANDVP